MEERRLNQRLSSTVDSLRKTRAELNLLQGLIPICSYCKKVRDDQGYWRQVEEYLHQKAGAEFSHSLCPQCIAEHYPNFKPRSGGGSGEGPGQKN